MLRDGAGGIEIEEPYIVTRALDASRAGKDGTGIAELDVPR